MVKVSKEVALEHRASLLKATGQVMRAEGVAVAGVAAIAGRVGLTHGAIYRQFASKDDLAAAAIAADFDTILALLDRIAGQGGQLPDYFQAYLTTDHRDHYDWGCPVAPLAAEIGRTAPQIRAAFTEGLHRLRDRVAELSGVQPLEQAQSYALLALATLSGALAMARATAASDPDLSQQILQSVLHSLMAQTPAMPIGPDP